MKKQEVLDKKKEKLIESMQPVYKFLQDTYEYEGQRMKYFETLTEAQINLLKEDGWNVSEKDNGGYGPMYSSWIEIS